MDKDNDHLANTKTAIISGNNYHWILKSVGLNIMRKDIDIASKYLPTRNLLIAKGKIITL